MPATQFTSIHHYVPRWYQQQFIALDAAERKYWYLDLQPDRVPKKNGGYYLRDELRRLGPANCFEVEHLYTLRFADGITDILEKRFFGRIDDIGAQTVKRFEELVQNWEDVERSPSDTINDCIEYLDAQKLRTVKGLAALSKLLGSKSHQFTLRAMRNLHQMNVTIWMEAVWEIFRCDNSPTKLIVTDHPVATYNRKMFPQSKHCMYPNDAPIAALGTQTLFALSPNHLLVLTNLGYVRDPSGNPLQTRINPRYFGDTLFDIRKIQTGRQLSEHDVLAVNFILKTGARRYIASSEREWLYPERRLKSTMWSKLGDRFFLMPDPRKVGFSTGMVVGYKDGGGWGVDEYGRPIRDGARDVESVRAREWSLFQANCKVWDNKFGQLSRDELRRFF